MCLYFLLFFTIFTEFRGFFRILDAFVLFVIGRAGVDVRTSLARYWWQRFMLVRLPVQSN